MRPGKFLKKIKIYTNDPAHQTVDVQCQGHALVAAKLSPAVASFGRIERSSGPQTRKITITQGDGGLITPKVLPLQIPGVEASLKEIAAGTHYELDVTISPPWPNGRIRSSILLATGVKESPRHPVQVVAEIPARVRVVPSEFRIGIGQPKTELVVDLTWIKPSEHKILEVTAEDPELSLSFENTPGGAKVVLQVPANYKPKSTQRTVTVRTDDEDIPSFEIPIRLVRSRPTTAQELRAKQKGAGAAPMKVRRKPQPAHFQKAPGESNTGTSPKAAPPAGPSD